MTIFYFTAICGLLISKGILDVHANDDGLCGLAEPDPTKTCISVRLPWEEHSMYFCTERKNITYRHQCQSLQKICKIPSENVLVVSTPWDCCPIESNPDYCKQVECPLKPFNRTCEEIGSAPNSCCPKYFCENNGGFSQCHLKITKPSCTEPPKNKLKCVAFNDQHGCCPKFQCEGDGKPGMCPMEVLANRYNVNQKAFEKADLDDEQITTISPISNNTAQSPHSNPNFFNAYVSMQRFSRACVGDYNCPGKMKCCSMQLQVYSDGAYLKRNTKPVVGVCTEPASHKTKINTMSHDVLY